LGKYDAIVLVVAHAFFKSLDYTNLKASNKTIKEKKEKINYPF
jgi:UDP-N-acetyl-D-mannosaminuronate dehydrogenase